MKVYLNYPNPRMTIHRESTCAEIGKMHKIGQRNLIVTPASITQVLGQLSSSEFQLGAQASVNDVWFTIDFDDAGFEEAVARYVHHLLSQRYGRLRGAQTQRHC